MRHYQGWQYPKGVEHHPPEGWWNLGRTGGEGYAGEGGIGIGCLVRRCSVVHRRGVVQFGLLSAMDFRVRFLQVARTGGSVVIVVPVWGPICQVDLS
jgi:hypothetical protein